MSGLQHMIRNGVESGGRGVSTVPRNSDRCRGISNLTNRAGKCGLEAAIARQY